jgi:hypothetical protein
MIIGLAGLMASCGSSVSSSTQPPTNDVYSLAVSPDRFTLNAGDWSSISAIVEVSNQNSAPRAVTPAPTVQFFSSDPRVSISPIGEVCAGQWDGEYLTCKPTSTLPTGYVTITATNASHNVSGTTQLSVHQRTASISLSSDWAISCPSSDSNCKAGTTVQRNCILQNEQVQYVAAPISSGGGAVGNVFANDYAWSVGDSNVASVSSFGYVIAHNPGVTNVYATLNGTISTPLTFVTCPPSAILLQTTPYTGGNPGSKFTSSDLTVPKGTQEYVAATLAASDGVNTAPLKTAPLSFVTSDLLTGSIAPTIPLTSTLTANTAGRLTMMAACEPSTCNNSVRDFTLPSGQYETGKGAGFGYPIYSNVIGVTVTGVTGSTVLVTGTTFADGTPAHRLQAYDSESLAITHTVVVPNTPNSLVVAPNGANAYIGDACPALSNCDGLVVVNLSSFGSSIKNYPVVGGLSTDVVTGKVLGVSPDSRYVLLSDVPNNLVFLIDTTGTKAAARYTIPGIRTVAFTPDGSNIWIGGDSGVYFFNADAFVPTPTNNSTGLKALAWTPDGQSYFASGDQLINYSTCDNEYQTSPIFKSLSGNPINLAATALSGVPRVSGLSVSDSFWYDYPVTTSAQVATGNTEGNVCLSSVTVNTPFKTSSTLQCTAQQVIFSPRLEEEFVTGVDPSCKTGESEIHGYDVPGHQEITLSTTSPTSTIVPLSGDVLNDGRKLYVGSYDATNGALLRRFDLTSRTEDFVTTCTITLTGTETCPAADIVVNVPAPVDLIPSFVAVVPK